MKAITLDLEPAALLTRSAKSCWILADAHGRGIDNGEHVEHFTSEDQAAKRAAEDAAVGEFGQLAEGTPRQLDEPCLTVHCPCCGAEYDQDGEGYTVHFESPLEAELVAESEWTAQGDGTYLCPACGPDGDCDDCQEAREAVSGRD